jgi:hypothetical protein
MFPYLAVYSFFLLFGLFDLFISDRKKIVMLSILTFLGLTMVIFAGMRWGTGTDWDTYRSYFVTIERRAWQATGMEIGYEFLVRFFKYFISSSQTPFLFFCAIVIIVFSYKTVYKFSPFPLFSLFLLISYSMVGSGFGVRQDLAIALSLFSITFIQERSLVKFLAVLMLAASIHQSAIIFIPAYFLYNFRWTTTRSILAISLVALCVLMSEKLMLSFGSLVDERKARIYMEMGMEQVSDPHVSLLKGLSGRLLFFLTAVGFVNYRDEKNSFYNGIFNIYVFGIVLYAIFSPINLIFSRLARPYDIFQIILIPLAYSNASRLMKVVIVVVIFAFSIVKFMSFLTADEGVYIPYKSVLGQ